MLAGFVDSVRSDDFDLPLNATPLDIARLGAGQLATEIAQAVNRQIARQKSNLPPSVGGRSELGYLRVMICQGGSFDGIHAQPL